MATTYNGIASFVYYPNITERNAHSTTDNDILKSLNQPIVYQVVVEHGSEGQDYTPTNTGDIVNVVFQVYINRGPGLQNTDSSNLIAEVRKAQDIPKEVYSNSLNTYINNNPAFPNGNTKGYRTFTVDLRSILQPNVGYGLVPVGRGSFNQWVRQGHLGGGYTSNYGENIWLGIQQGVLKVRVECKFEVLNSSGQIEIANNGTSDQKIYTSSNSFISNQPSFDFYGINAVRQSYERQDLKDHFIRLSNGDSGHKFLSMCPNGDGNNSDWASPRYYKPARMDERQDALYFFLFSMKQSTAYTTYAGDHDFQSRVFKVYLKVEAVDSSGVSTGIKYLDASTDCFMWSIGAWQDSSYGWSAGTYVAGPKYPEAWLAQNVSPDYINNSPGSGTAIPITATTDRYRVSIEWMDNESGTCDIAGSPSCPTGICCEDSGGSWNGTTYRNSEYRYFKIDRENETPAFPYLRVHWLNSLGGIDSYTFKRNKVESITRKSTEYERKPNDPQWALRPMAPDYDINAMIDTTLTLFGVQYALELGSDQYKTTNEVLNVQARRKGTVYSEPLTIEEANWLSEIVKSPNVWIEVENERATINARSNPSVFQGTYHLGENYWYQKARDYSPIIVDDGETITMDEEQKMVMFKLSYKHANGEMTQSN